MHLNTSTDDLRHEPRFVEGSGDVRFDFDWYQDQFGRCEGKIYRDLPNGDAHQVGWNFRRGDVLIWCEYGPMIRDYKRTFHELVR